MKKIFLLLAISILSGSCAKEQKQKTEYDNSDANAVSVVVIDECEYIQYKIVTYMGIQNCLTHKGNCKFCNERIPKNTSSTK